MEHATALPDNLVAMKLFTPMIYAIIGVQYWRAGRVANNRARARMGYVSCVIFLLCAYAGYLSVVLDHPVWAAILGHSLKDLICVYFVLVNGPRKIIGDD